MRACPLFLSLSSVCVAPALYPRPSLCFLELCFTVPLGRAALLPRQQALGPFESVNKSRIGRSVADASPKTASPKIPAAVGVVSSDCSVLLNLPMGIY